MPCYFPLLLKERGHVPCGQCIGCRLEYSRQWAVRCMHEASMFSENCFLTLTYRQELLPPGGSLVKAHVQGFIRSLRTELRRDGVGITSIISAGSAVRIPRYYLCGEYGERFGRPHYHVLLFGYGFPDRERLTERAGSPVWRSAQLERHWPYGLSEIGTVTFESAAYVARYVTKKVSGPERERHYRVCDPETGEVFVRLPEFALMSRRPGIGRPWFDRYGAEVVASDEVVARGVACRPPRYYDGIRELVDPGELERARQARREKRKFSESLPSRLEAARVVTEAKVNLHKRGLE